MIKWMFGLLLLLSLLVRSHPTEAARHEYSLAALEADLDDFPALQIRYLDDPVQNFEWIKKLQPSLKPEAKPEAWIRALWFASKRRELTRMASQEQIEAAIKSAYQLGMFVEWTEFRVHEIEEETYQGDAFEPRKARYEELIQELRQTGDKSALALGLATYAEFLLINQNLDQAMLVIDEMNGIQDEEQTPIIVYDMVKYVFALALRYQGQLDASIAIQLEMEKRYVKLNLRNARGYNLYDLSLAHTDQALETVQKNQHKIAGYHLEAIRLGFEIGDRYLIAMNQYGLSFLRSKVGQWTEALNFAEKAVAYFDSGTDQEWQSRAHTRLASALIDAGRHQDSLKHLDIAERFTSLSNNTRRADIEEFRYQVHRKLGRTKEALESLETYMTLYKKYSKERSKQSFNQTAVKLGLQYQAERNKALAKQNELQAEQINLLKKFRLVSLIAAGLFMIACGALYVVWRQASAIRRSRLQMKEVLDHIDEGIVILDRHLQVRGGYSSYLDRLFSRPEHDLQGVRLLDLLFPKGSPNHEQGIIVREILSTCIGEEALNWELNHAHLPHELQHGNLILQLHWQPLYNSHRLIVSFLISIRDITSLRAIESRMKEETQRVQLLQNKWEEVLSGKVPLIRDLIRELEEAWPQLEAEVFQVNQQPAVLRRLHTWKGAARTLGLKELATRIHDMESCLVQNASASSSMIEARWRSLALAFQDYQHLLSVMLVSQRAEDDTTADLYAYASLYAREMKLRLDQAGCPQQGIMVLDNVHGWRKKILPRIHEILLHAVSNALDHGFIRPSKKVRSSAPALIQIRSRRVEQGVELQIQDNGAGIDWAQLQKKADEKGVVLQPGQALTDLLFVDGLSTADVATETSGRGVGLSAIHSICKELGGHITLDSAEGGGTLLCMRLPETALTESQGGQIAPLGESA